MEHIALYTEEKTIKSLRLRLKVPVVCFFLVFFFFFMRVEFLEGLFGGYCFQAVCLLGFCSIFHFMIFFWEICKVHGWALPKHPFLPPGLT